MFTPCRNVDAGGNKDELNAPPPTLSLPPEVKYAVINVGSGTETSMLELVAEIERQSGRRINLIINGEKSGGVPRLAADISRARELLGFRPQVDLEHGLRLMLEQDARFIKKQ